MAARVFLSHEYEFPIMGELPMTAWDVNMGRAVEKLHGCPAPSGQLWERLAEHDKLTYPGFRGPSSLDVEERGVALMGSLNPYERRAYINERIENRRSFRGIR